MASFNGRLLIPDGAADSGVLSCERKNAPLDGEAVTRGVGRAAKPLPGAGGKLGCNRQQGAVTKILPI